MNRPDRICLIILGLLIAELPSARAAENPATWKNQWACCPDPKYRDGKKAIALANRAIELAGSAAGWGCFAALAAAQAEAGEFDLAVMSQKLALTYNTLGSEDRVRMKARLTLYEQRKPFHDQ